MPAIDSVKQFFKDYYSPENLKLAGTVTGTIGGAALGSVFGNPLLGAAVGGKAGSFLGGLGGGPGESEAERTARILQETDPTDQIKKILEETTPGELDISGLTERFAGDFSTIFGSSMDEQIDLLNREFLISQREGERATRQAFGSRGLTGQAVESQVDIEAERLALQRDLGVFQAQEAERQQRGQFVTSAIRGEQAAATREAGDLRSVLLAELGIQSTAERQTLLSEEDLSISSIISEGLTDITGSLAKSQGTGFNLDQ